MSTQQNQQRADGPSMKDSFNVVYFLSLVLATCFTPVFRRNFGREALGSNAAVALLFMLVYGAMVEPLVLYYLVFIWLACLIGQRTRTWQNERRGIIPHSRYAGTPVLAMTLLFARNETRGRSVEPVFCLVLFFASMPLSSALATFFLLGFLGLTFVHGIDQMAIRRRIMHMRDAALENRYMAQRYRDEIGDL